MASLRRPVPPGVVATVGVVDRRRDQLRGLDAEALAAPAGQTSARWQILAAVEGAPRSVADVARLMNLARQSVQRIADLLVDDGLACYEDNPAHARAKHLCLSASGHHMLARIQDAQRQWANGLAAGLDLDQLRAGSDLLAQVTLLLQSGADET